MDIGQNYEKMTDKSINFNDDYMKKLVIKIYNSLSICKYEKGDESLQYWF